MSIPPSELECVSCHGNGCHDCKGQGFDLIDRCPLRMIDGDVIELVRFARLAAKGSWPIGGGTLDQLETFVRFCEFVWGEDDRWRRTLGIDD